MSEIQQPPQEKKHRIDVMKWGWLAVFVLLAGRYQWNQQNRALAKEGYLASAWMLAILSPTVFGITRIFCGRAAAIVAGWIVAIVCALPYRWLGLAGTRFWSDHFSYGNWINDANAPLPSIAWFPAAFRQGPVIPHEGLVFGLIAMCGLVAVMIASRGRLLPRNFTTHPEWVIAILALVLILAQSWLHLSLRSPYSYQMHYAERTPTQKAWIEYDSHGHPTVHVDEVPRPHGWWHLYLLPGYRGAVNYDYGDFRAAEEVFQGVAPDQDSPVMRRLFTFYISSQFVCFFNPYYVFLFLNTACWTAAALAGFGLARRLTDSSTAAVFALLIATGCGFIFFANQPTSYLSGYAAVIIVMYLFERLIVEHQHTDGVWLFGAAYCLALLTSDLLPMLAFFPVYAIARKASMRRVIGALAVGCCLYGISLAFLGYVAHVPNLLGNYDLLGSPLGEAKNFTLNQIYILCLEVMNRFAMDMFHGFLILPIVAAIVGIALVNNGRRMLAIVAMFLPALVTVAVLEFSRAHFRDWPLAGLPRLAYIAYPAVYLLAAIGVVETSRRVFAGHPAMARFAPYLFLLCVFALNNLDVFGAPAIYYQFYFGMNSGGFMPFGNP